MKKIIIFIAIVVFAVIVYNQLKGSSSSSSPDEQKIERLSNDFRRVKRDFNEANSATALGGADISDEMDKAYSEVARIDAELTAIRGQLTSESARKKADRLRVNIDAFKRSLTK